jgi:hypothetical protein
MLLLGHGDKNVSAPFLFHKTSNDKYDKIWPVNMRENTDVLHSEYTAFQNSQFSALEQF